MELQELVIIPSEIRNSIENVSTDKKKEIELTLSQIFAGTSKWKEQVNAIEVAGIDDKMSIQLAEVARKNAKDARLSAEKMLDLKREEVQKLKIEFDTEDKMWLKVKQIVQITFKEIESIAEYKASFRKRYESEQKELKALSRIAEVMKFSNEINRIEFENMSDQTFDSFLSGLETTHNAKVEAEKELERVRVEKEEEAKKEQERIRLENITLKVQAEKDATLKVIADAERKAIEDKARKEKELADAKLEEVRQENEKLQKAIQDKADAERKAIEDAQKDKDASELLMKKDADKLAKAPIKKQAKIWVEGFTLPESNFDNEVKRDILIKFEAFKKWALTQTENI